MLYNRCTGIYKFGNNTYPQHIRHRSILGHIFREKKYVLWAGKYGKCCLASLTLWNLQVHVRSDKSHSALSCLLFTSVSILVFHSCLCLGFASGFFPRGFLAGFIFHLSHVCCVSTNFFHRDLVSQIIGEEHKL